MNVPSNTQSKIAVVQGYFRALENGDLKALGELFADHIRWHQPGSGSLSGTYHGKDEVFALLTRFMTLSEGTFRIDKIDSIMANNEYVAATLHFSAQKANGQSISMRGVDLMKIDENGRIEEVFLFSGDPSAEDTFWG